MKYRQNRDLLRQCRNAWELLEPFRRRRRTCKDYAYGRQWRREVTLPDGRRVTEEEKMLSEGTAPLTNNLIRQLLKTVIGKWRYLRVLAGSTDGEVPSLGAALSQSSPVDALDARALEEFLISGFTAQRVGGSTDPVENVSPERMFFTPFMREDGSDARIIGMLRDMSLTEVLRAFSGGDTEACRALAELFRHSSGTDEEPFRENAPTEFGRSATADTMRVIEVWRRRPQPLLRLHDIATAGYAAVADDVKTRSRLAGINAKRRREGTGEIVCLADIADVWEHVCLAPSGEVLASEILPETAVPPLTVRCYPMIDGEIHSLVEDVISHQQYVNRLIMMLDEVLRYSAKGVLLYPADQLPDGMDWSKLRAMWSIPGSIIPYVRNSKNIMPRQINNSGTLGGASEMLRTQLELFSRVSGTSLTADAGMRANSADMLRRQMENEMISLLDLLASFEAFISRRNEVLRLQHPQIRTAGNGESAEGTRHE